VYYNYPCPAVSPSEESARHERFYKDAVSNILPYLLEWGGGGVVGYRGAETALHRRVHLAGPHAQREADEEGLSRGLGLGPTSRQGTTQATGSMRNGSTCRC